MTNKFEQEEYNNEDFEKLLEESLNVSDDFQPGDKVQGTIVFTGKEDTFLNIAGKSEAVISTIELQNEDGTLKYKKGDKVEAYVVSAREGEIRVTFTIGKGDANPELLRIAFTNEMPVEGTVTAEIKGGFSVNISGQRCFCPFSQIDIKSSDNRESYLNKTFTFRIVEFKENGRNIIVSRRIILEEMQANAEKDLKNTLKTGDKVTGEITSSHEFGFFVNIGGLEALIPKSEISWSRSKDSVNLKTGQKVEARVIDIDWNSRKITLSIKQLTPEPWSVHKLQENQVINGRVAALIPQGAFVELEPGIDGFLHISKMSVTKKISKPQELVNPGDSINVRINSINNKDRKISLELITDEADPWQSADEKIMNEIHKGTVESINNSGVSVRISGGMLGFIPKNELLNSSDMQKNYNAGSEVTVSVKDFDKNSRKLILSEKGAIRKEEEKELNAFLSRNTEASGTSLGGLFKDKFSEIQKQVKK